MKKIIRLALNPVTWILVLLGVVVAKKLVAVAATSSIEPAAGDEWPDDDATF